MTVIIYFIPYLYVFAAMIKLQREPAGPEVIRVPGGRPVAVLSRDRAAYDDSHDTAVGGAAGG